MSFYAKSCPKETIAEHTELLLQEMKRVREMYGDRIKDADERLWEILELAVRMHDAGKANVLFQNKLKKSWGEPPLPTSLSPKDEIPHNYLSIALIPFRQLKFSREEWELLIEAIGFHHERDTKPDQKGILIFFERSGMAEIVESIYQHLSLPFRPEKIPIHLLTLLETNRGNLDRKLRENSSFFRKHVLLKGLLHRLDYAASAHVEVERGEKESPEKKTRDFLMKMKKFQLRPAQAFAAEHQFRHLIMVSSTGSGKTEAALLWAGREKVFITLPLRVSLNAMYSRLKDREKIGLDSLGLLHSGSSDYLLNYDAIDGEVTYTQSRQLSEKVMLTTVDQVLKFPFYYKGFEKELVTFSYAKLVIDEIQAYDPKIAAMLLRAIELIDQMGGKVMIMTATLPKLYLEMIESRQLLPPGSWAFERFANDDFPRHCFAIESFSLEEMDGSIVNDGKEKKVLVICNTVNKSIQMYKRLTDLVKGECSVHLLHARFTKEDKDQLEAAVTDFAESEWHTFQRPVENGVWVTTQIVEASLDVDFDKLYTELCPLDSLFQRMGRCYRVRKYEKKIPNIIIAAEEVSGIGSVYDKKIVEMSTNDLISYQNRVLLESEKMDLVENLYNRKRLQGTEYLHEFDEAVDFFESRHFYESKSHEAQKMLRDIQTKSVIPMQFLDELQPLLKVFEKTNDKVERKRVRRQIEAKSVVVRESFLRGIELISLNVKGLEYLWWIHENDASYQFDKQRMQGTGLEFKKASQKGSYFE